jgi:phosphatidylglycerophosphatase C
VSDQGLDGRQVVAAFDFDKTLARRDTVVPFLRLVSGSAALVGKLTLQSHRLAPAALRRQRDVLRAEATRLVFGGRPIGEVDNVAAPFGARLVSQALRPDTLARLHWHRNEGHRVVIVSASYEAYLRVVADLLGIDAALGTRLDVVDGVCTGRLDGPNCRGPEKVIRLDRWLDSQELAHSDVELWAYGDSAGDRELLAAADHPVWARRRLTSVAPTRS